MPPTFVHAYVNYIQQTLIMFSNRPIKPKTTALAVHRPIYKSLEKKPLRRGPSMPFLCDVSLSDIAKSVEGHFARIK